MNYYEFPNFSKFPAKKSPQRHYSYESVVMHLGPPLYLNLSAKSLTWICSRGCSGAHHFGRQGRRRWRAARRRQALAYAHSHRALAWTALAWEGPATCMGGMPRRRPAMAAARRRGSGVVWHERGARHGEAEGQQRWRQSFAWRHRGGSPAARRSWRRHGAVSWKQEREGKGRGRDWRGQ